MHSWCTCKPHRKIERVLKANVAGDPLKILILTVRADIGGGPEHIFQLLSAVGPKVEFALDLPG